MLRVFIALSLALCGTIQAQAADSSSGCGLGWYVLKENTLLSSSLRSTTHAALPNTFSMTLGTSNCAKHAIVDHDKRSLHFAEANQDQLMLDIAQGQGEYIAAFSATFDCSWQTLPAFEQAMKHGFERIYTRAETSPAEVVDRVHVEIRNNPVLAMGCAA